MFYQDYIREKCGDQANWVDEDDDGEVVCGGVFLCVGVLQREES